MIRANTRKKAPTRPTRRLAARARAAAGAALASAGLAAMAPGSVQAGVIAIPIGSFVSPVYVTVDPFRVKFLYVVEQAGRVRLLRDEATLAKPFLDIRRIVFGPPDSGAGGEQGLLSIAFAPNYETSGLFYVAFTNKKGALEIDEFKRSKKKANRADPKSRRVLLTIPHPNHQNHNGGQLQFGPDKRLYISTGDGGGGDDVEDNARRKNKLLGKLLRIDPRPGKKLAYRIPKTNPFVHKKGRDEIFSYGLRNAWRFSFDGKRLLIGDVGQNAWEEIDMVKIGAANGANFGWPQYEGNAIHDNSRPGADPVTFPELVYSHDSGCSVTGGYVMHDPVLPAYDNRYIYSDYCSGDIRTFKAVSGAPDDRSEGVTLSGIVSFGRGHGGQIYTVQLGGTVSRIEPDS